MDSLRPWVDAARPGQAVLAPLCVAVGSSYAHFDAHRGPGLAAQVLVTLAALAAGLGVNLIDHAWDRLGAPPPDPKTPNPDALPPVSARESAVGGVAAIVLAALFGVGLASLSGSATLGYGMVAVTLGAARRAPVVGLDTMGSGLGEIAQVLALGPLAAMAGFASQTGSGSSGAFLAGVPAGLVAAAALFDRRGSRRDLDAKVERGVAVALPLLATAAIAIAARAGEYGPWAQAAAVPMIVAAAAAWRFPTRPSDADVARGRGLALVCAVAALASIVAGLGLGAPA
jgi:1,4-dihydroxy-2-naphthoate octaprenyltransferase